MTAASVGANGSAIVSKAYIEAARRTHVVLTKPGRDRNAEFLCTYNGYSVFNFISSSSNFQSSVSQKIAIPIWGHGRAVKKIVVEEYASPTTSFSLGIYSNTPSGMPGRMLAGGSTQASSTCGRRSVAIPKTFLSSGEKYWIEETVSRARFFTNNGVIWAFNPNSNHKAYSQTHNFFSSSSTHFSSTSPWRLTNNFAPYFRVK